MGLNELYGSIVDEVVGNVRESFLEEGFDEQTLINLKEVWLRKISEAHSRPQQQLQQQSSVIQQQHHQVARNIPQLDGSNVTSDEDDDIDVSDGDFPEGDDDASDEEDKETEAIRDDEDPLNSGDDVSNDGSSEMCETDNVIVCQYDKITRNRNKWKFHLKDGIMNLNGRDYVFQKAVGDAEW